jgi:HEPN domain-containing protein
MVISEASCRDWLWRADADLRVVELALADAHLPDWAIGCYLQQTCEKALKAMLAAHGRKPPRTHDLGQLAETIESEDAAFGPWQDRLVGLDAFAALQRHPDAPEPNIDLRSAYKDAMKLLELAKKACATSDHSRPSSRPNTRRKRTNRAQKNSRR